MIISQNTHKHIKSIMKLSTTRHKNTNTCTKEFLILLPAPQHNTQTCIFWSFSALWWLYKQCTREWWNGDGSVIAIGSTHHDTSEHGMESCHHCLLFQWQIVCTNHPSQLSLFCLSLMSSLNKRWPFLFHYLHYTPLLLLCIVQLQFGLTSSPLSSNLHDYLLTPHPSEKLTNWVSNFVTCRRKRDCWWFLYNMLLLPKMYA